MRHFVLMTDPMSQEEQANMLAGLIQARGMAWMHYTPGGWLLADENDRETASTINEALGIMFPDKRNIVVQVTPSSWAVRLASEHLPAQRDWMEAYWEPHRTAQLRQG